MIAKYKKNLVITFDTFAFNIVLLDTFHINFTWRWRLATGGWRGVFMVLDLLKKLF